METVEAVEIKLNPLRTGRDHFARASVFHRAMEFLKKSDKYAEYAAYEGPLYDYAHLVVALDRGAPQPKGHEFPSVSASGADIARAFTRWCALEYEVIMSHRDAINASAPAPTNPDIAPDQPEPETDAEKNA